MKTWVIQSSAIKPINCDKAMDRCLELGNPYMNVGVINSLDKIVNFEQLNLLEDYFFYGSTKLIKLIYKSDYRHGVFYNPLTFNVAAWSIYRDDMLNDDAVITTVEDFLKLDGVYFVRPYHDLKPFSGEVVEGDKIEWYNSASHNGSVFNKQTYVAYSSPKTIDAEIRVFIIDGKVVTASYYRYKGRTHPMPIPNYWAESILNLQKLADKWLPLQTVVMDVALVGDTAKVIEFNCINASGFYEADVDKIIKAL